MLVLNFRRLAFLVGILMAGFNAYGQIDGLGGEYVDFGISVSITEGEFIVTNEVGFLEMPAEIRIANYAIVEESEVPFVIDAHGEKRLLLLQSLDQSLLFIYMPGRTSMVFGGMRKEIYEQEYLVTPGNSTASSFLTEGEMEYRAENIERIRLDEPWVEGVPGQGIGEWIEFSLGPFTALYFFNGFISFDRPDLYLRNSRVSEVTVRDMTTGDEWVEELLDTPNPQFIDLNGRSGHQIRLIIAKVYPGTVYADTCVAGILLRK